ncbi:SLAM family member 5-like, partial [Acipenser oxyrinchus oxyrinchus]
VSAVKEDTRFLLPLPASGQPRSAAQLATQQVKGIVGESFTFPVEIPNLQPDTEINWRYGPVELDSTIARIQNGKIEVFEKRFKARLQLDNMSSSLRINGLEREDSGFYQVETIRGNGFIKIFQLSVYSECHSRMFLKSTGVWLANRSCTLLCFVGSASEVNVFWIRDGKPLNTTELEISQEMQGDNVTYTCVASNPASNKSITVTPSDYCVKKEAMKVRILILISNSNPASNKNITVTPSHYCGKRNGNRGKNPDSYSLISFALATLSLNICYFVPFFMRTEGETTTIRPSTEITVRVLVFIVLSGVVIAVCVTVWKKINASSECR